MPQVPIPTKACEVKASLDRLRAHMGEARHYTVGFPGTPAYVQRTTQHIALKLFQLDREARHLQEKCPDKFRSE